MHYFVSEFAATIKIVADRMARHEEAVNVDPRHVNEAFDAMCRLGLQRQVWWKRHDLEVGVGSFLFSLGLTAPSLLAQFLEGSRGLQIGTLAGLLILGGGLAVHGWYRGRL